MWLESVLVVIAQLNEWFAGFMLAAYMHNIMHIYVYTLCIHIAVALPVLVVVW